MLSRWTPAALAAPFVLKWIGPERPTTGPFLLWHLLMHDLHHSGELAHTLGVQGMLSKLPPPRLKS